MSVWVPLVPRPTLATKINTASLYANEADVGRAMASCGVPRSDLFVRLSCGMTTRAIGPRWLPSTKSLDRLGLDHLDLYVIHWPVPAIGAYLETWRTFEEIY